MLGKHRRRVLIVLAAAVGIAAFFGCAQAGVWDGHTVIAQDESGALAAAVVADPTTDGLTLLIAEEQDNAFAIAVRGERAVPADWSTDAIIVEAFATGNGRYTYPTITVKVPTGEKGSWYSMQIVRMDTGWELAQLRGQSSNGGIYSLYHEPDGVWATLNANGTQRATLPANAFDAALAALDAQAALNAADNAIQAKAQWELDAVRELWDTAFAGTSWANADLIKSELRYTNGVLDATLVAARIGNATALCVFAKSGEGWVLAANNTLLPPGIDANELSLQFQTDMNIDPEEFRFSVKIQSPELDSPVVAFRRDTQDTWRAMYATFWDTEESRWRAVFETGVMQLYPGSYIGEEGYLYTAVDPELTALMTFDIQAVKNAMYQLFDDFMAGEPPMIPTDGSAYALPQPCGAQLKKGTYAVYSGPGKQYYREADGKAAVSANDWVQVFGMDGDWVLVQYRIRNALLRFGYIQKKRVEESRRGSCARL